jgi:hypothetical protein
MFYIGDKVQFGKELWKVMYYHKINDKYEIMFQSTNKKNKRSRSVPLAQLEQGVSDMNKVKI